MSSMIQLQRSSPFAIRIPCAAQAGVDFGRASVQRSAFRHEARSNFKVDRGGLEVGHVHETEPHLAVTLRAGFR
jgi:hypothetical protein